MKKLFLLWNTTGDILFSLLFFIQINESELQLGLSSSNIITDGIPLQLVLSLNSLYWLIIINEVTMDRKYCIPQGLGMILFAKHDCSFTLWMNTTILSWSVTL